MKRAARLLAGVAVALLACPGFAAASVPPQLQVPAGLSIAEIKFTGDELLVLQNNTAAAITDLSNYWIYDFNSTDPLAPGTSSSSQQLPDATLDPGQTLLLSDNTRATCGAELAGKLSVSLTDSGGFLELVKLSQDQTTHQLIQTAGDSVSWSEQAAGTIQNAPSSSADPAAVYYRTQNPAGWQLADIDTPAICQLQVAAAAPAPPPPTVDTGGLIAPTSQPPATIISLKTAAPTETKALPSLPPADIGLAAPQIAELLPNPTGTGTDDTAEFIEIYNSNSKPFDLSGFTLETGISRHYKYEFPAGTTIAAKSFKAFYSSETGVSLSNSGSQATLLDPFGKTIAQTAEYGTAKDGEAWALANGKWYWTTAPTPNAANKIQQTGSASTVLGAKTQAQTSSSKSSAGQSSGNQSAPIGATNAADTSLQVTPIHPWTLALVAALAVAWGLYEYRHDVANKLYQLRAHRTAGRQNRR